MSTIPLPAAALAAFTAKVGPGRGADQRREAILRELIASTVELADERGLICADCDDDYCSHLERLDRAVRAFRIETAGEAIV